MTAPIHDTNPKKVRKALANGEIKLKDIEGWSPDLKTAFQEGTLDWEFNERYKGFWSNLADNGRLNVEDAVEDACSFPPLDDPIERLFAHDRMQREKGRDYGCHCDGSKSSQIVPRAINHLYRALWPETSADSGDTMNSSWTTFKQYVCILQGWNWGRTGWEKALGEIVDENGHLQERSFGREDWRDVVDQLRILAYLTHTPGDFIPCGGAFNIGRSNAMTRDYWDLTLIEVRDWYLNQSKNLTSVTVFGADREWLSEFGVGVEGWNTFVKDNYLQPYMEEVDGSYETEAAGSYTVRPFFAGHGPGHVLPQDKEEILDCLLSMNAAIIARGNLMRNRLIELNENGEIDLGLFFED